VSGRFGSNPCRVHAPRALQGAGAPGELEEGLVVWRHAQRLANDCAIGKLRNFSERNLPARQLKHSTQLKMPTDKLLAHRAHLRRFQNRNAASQINSREALH
jgi:hypothetical protein